MVRLYFTRNNYFDKQFNSFMGYESNRTEKPLDTWLALSSIAIGVGFYLLPKTPVVVLSSLFLILVILIHPLWHFWWIEAELWRRCAATLVLIVVLFLLGQNSWPIKSPTLSQSISYKVLDFGKWIAGSHSRWFDRFIGASAVVVLAFLWRFGKRVINLRSALVYQPQKGFLDHKLEAEVAMASMPKIVGMLTAVMSEVGPAMERYSSAMQSAVTTNQQVRVSKAASSGLDKYTAKLERIQPRFIAAGKDLSEGLNGWSKWIEHSHPGKAAFAGFPEAITTFIDTLIVSNNLLREYIATVTQLREASSVLDAAVERHVRSWEPILATYTKIYEGCTKTLAVLEQLS